MWIVLLILVFLIPPTLFGGFFISALIKQRKGLYKPHPVWIFFIRKRKEKN